jgi:hypothetical protein
MSEGIKLEKNTEGEWDMVFSDGAFELCTEGESAMVQMVERLLLTRVESLVNPLVNTNKDPQAGTDWYGTVLDDSQDKIVGELEIKRVILGTPGVISITEWDPTYPGVSNPGHTMTLSARVLTAWGEIALNETLGV